jgi:hypothetical protein
MGNLFQQRVGVERLVSDDGIRVQPFQQQAPVSHHGVGRR